MEQYNAKFAEVYDIFMDNTDYDAWANYIISLRLSERSENF